MLGSSGRMAHKQPPDSEFIRSLTRVRAREREPRWKSEDGRIFIWDGLHGELEMYNKRGKHLGVVNPETGAMMKGAVQGRNIDV